MRKRIIILLAFCQSLSLAAQDLSQDFKHWYLSSLTLRMSPSTSLTLGHLSSFDVEGYQHKFQQSRVILNQKLSDSWTLSGGYSYSIIRGSRSNTPYHRLEAQLAHRLELGPFRLSNRIRAEKYFPQLAKFGSRYVYTQKWSYYNRNWPLRFSPFMKHQLFYYQGGKEINYWLPSDEIEEGEEPFITNATNGLHRYRLTLGARMRLHTRLYLSLFYTYQREFNTGLSPYTALNVPNESGSRIQRPFNNYSLLGLSLAYTLKLY